MASCQQNLWHISFLYLQWKTPDDGHKNCPKRVEFYSKNKFEKLLHLVGFIIRIYHDARSAERQNLSFHCCSKTIYHMDWTPHPPHPQFHIFNLPQQNKKNSTERRAPAFITTSFWEHEVLSSGFDLRELGCSQVASLGWPLAGQRNGGARAFQLSGIRNHTAFLRPDLQYVMSDSRGLQNVGRCAVGLLCHKNHCILPTEGSLS